MFDHNMQSANLGLIILSQERVGKWRSNTQVNRNLRGYVSIGRFSIAHRLWVLLTPALFLDVPFDPGAF